MFKRNLFIAPFMAKNHFLRACTWVLLPSNRSRKHIPLERTG